MTELQKAVFTTVSIICTAAIFSALTLAYAFGEARGQLAAIESGDIDTLVIAVEWNVGDSLVDFGFKNFMLVEPKP